jgi:hypothetical protein
LNIGKRQLWLIVEPVNPSLTLHPFSFTFSAGPWLAEHGLDWGVTVSTACGLIVSSDKLEFATDIGHDQV